MKPVASLLVGCIVIVLVAVIMVLYEENRDLRFRLEASTTALEELVKDNKDLRFRLKAQSIISEELLNELDRRKPRRLK